MPKKNVREMSDLERKRYSLEARTFHTTIIGAVILGIVTFVIGMGLYAYALAGQYTNEAYNLTRHVESVVENVADVQGYGRVTMEAYYSADEEQREEQNLRYLSNFASVRFDDSFNTLMGVMREFLDNSDAEYLYIGMYDPERSALVFIADPDPNRGNAYKTGMWQHVDPEEVEKFLDQKRGEKVYHITRDEDDGWICTSGVPVFNIDGTISCFILADVSLMGLISGMRYFAIRYIIAILIITLLLAFFVTKHIKKTIVDPINEIADAAVSYARDKRLGNSVRDHFEGLSINTGDEIENLYMILTDMETDLNTYEEDLTNAVKEQERLGTELELATRIQTGMLPGSLSSSPGRGDFDIYGSMTPAKEVGGDFYDYFLIDDDHLCMIMADVSGKGVPAALFMMASNIFLKTSAAGLKDPAAVLTKVNDQIVRNNPQEMFVTVWLGILELSTGKLTASNAGHEYPIIRHSGSGYEIFKDKHGFVIGGMEGMKYKNYDIHLEPGSEIFVYTDGVPEATNSSNELFGMDRLLESLNGNAAAGPREVLENVNCAIDHFVGDAPQFDDITMMSMIYYGPDALGADELNDLKEADTVKEMTLEATVNNIPMVTDFVNQELEALGCPLKAQMQIDVAIDELFGNIAQYAYDPSTGPATVRVEVEEDPMAVIVTFIDNGKPYDPLKTKEPDVTLSAEDREIGGLGVFLVKKTMDDVSYEYKNGQNILRIRKNM